jgi:hypothetical protein
MTDARGRRTKMKNNITFNQLLDGDEVIVAMVTYGDRVMVAS